MKTRSILSLVAMLMAFHAYSQGFVYDQQSATSQAGGSGAPIQADQPMGQSFMPTLPSVSFVQLEFLDFPTNGLGATVFVNLWSGSISNGTLLSSTDPVFIPDGAFNLITNFLFPASVAVTPETTYFLQPYVQSGDPGMDVVGSATFNYPGGTFYAYGAPDPNNHDLWFREGMVAVPEPSTMALALIGSGIFFYARRRHKKSVP